MPPKDSQRNCSKQPQLQKSVKATTTSQEAPKQQATKSTGPERSPTRNSYTCDASDSSFAPQWLARCLLEHNFATPLSGIYPIGATKIQASNQTDNPLLGLCLNERVGFVHVPTLTQELTIPTANPCEVKSVPALQSNEFPFESEKDPSKSVQVPNSD